MTSLQRGLLVLLGSLTLAACQSARIQSQPASSSVQDRLPATSISVSPVATSPTSSPPPEADTNIIVTAPAAGATVSSPVRITGRARVFEAALTVAVYDAQGNRLSEKHIMASASGPEFGLFDAELAFAAPVQQAQGRIEAFSHSARDGSVINRVAVPVTLQGRSGGAAVTVTPQR